MMFEFQLTLVEEIRPWGESPNKKLHWFGLTDGKYRLNVVSEYLLNYSEEFVVYLTEKFPEYVSDTTFVDYQVVRLWEDILVMLPSILEPVPDELQPFLNSGYENYRNLNDKALDWQESKTTKEIYEKDIWDTADLLTYWLNDRWLDSGYLSPPARIWIWSDDNDVIISWDNQEIKVENIPVWSSTQGNYQMSRKDFISEVKKFDHNLISQMNDRVETICQKWDNPEIKIDFESLQFEQRHRGTWLESPLNHTRKTNWDEVISAIKTINL